MPASDLFQDIDPLESYVTFEKHQQYFSAGREYAECFSARNDLVEEKGEVTADDIYYIESAKEGDQDQEKNAFEIFSDKNSKGNM